MADRSAVIQLVSQFVPSGKEQIASKIIPNLVDACVETISAESRWSWRETKDDTYTFSPNVSTYNLPVNCETVLRIGKLEDGLMTVKFLPLNESYLIDHYSQLQGTADIHYVPLDIDDATKRKSFRLFPMVTQAIAGRVKYLRIPSKDDIRFITNTMLLVNLVLGSMPNELIGGNPQSDVAGRYLSLYKRQIENQITKDEKSRELVVSLEPSGRNQAVNNYLRQI